MLGVKLTLVALYFQKWTHFLYTDCVVSSTSDDVEETTIVAVDVVVDASMLIIGEVDLGMPIDDDGDDDEDIGWSTMDELSSPARNIKIKWQRRCE